MGVLSSSRFHAGLWIATVTALMLLPADALPELRSWLPVSLAQWVDKVEHVGAFLFMTVLLARACRDAEPQRGPTRKAMLWTLGIALALELMQALIPWRYFDPLDLVADGVGVLLGSPAAAWVMRLEARPEVEC